MSDLAHNRALVPPGLVTPEVAAPASPQQLERATRVDRAAFQRALAERVSGLQFSGHAVQRIERRGIDVGAPTMVRLEAGVARAAGKGARDSVVFVDGTAFVVSVRNRPVITAVDPEHMREHVFTNIDSAVIS
jgi:flagellar operon protein